MPSERDYDIQKMYLLRLCKEALRLTTVGNLGANTKTAAATSHKPVERGARIWRRGPAD